VLRFLADEHIAARLVRGLLEREPAPDVVRVQDVGFRRADDPTILAWAAEHGRVLLTETNARYRAMRTRGSEPGSRFPA